MKEYANMCEKEKKSEGEKKNNEMNNSLCTIFVTTYSSEIIYELREKDFFLFIKYYKSYKVLQNI